AMLGGEAGAYRDIALMNAAASLIVAGKADDLKSGVALAKTSIDSGDALACLEKLVAITNA
ncbi:MAG: anthranilate phosphoribosyltransferase, partial [Rhodospirillales bacterium]